ncbi:MAG: FAD-dependent thymidylate synthase [Pseudomonadota bacterium]
MSHVIVETAEAILDKEFPVLDHGFVRLVDYFGGDSRIVQAARVSYGKGTKSVRQDRGLINYLVKNRHTSPLEQVVLTLHCKMPIFVARQWIRHRTARLNEISGRYSVLDSEFYIPEEEYIRYQSKENKQGRSDEEVPPELRTKVLETLRQEQEQAYNNYQALLQDGVARELARVNLPLSLYTQWYWQIDLHNLFHFLRLRLDSHAQLEIRLYAQVIADIAKAIAPLAYEAFEEHILHAICLSRTEVAALKEILAGRPNPLTDNDLAEFEKKVGPLSLTKQNES